MFPLLFSIQWKFNKMDIFKLENTNKLKMVP